MKKYDFGGYATRYNVLCADGRIIKPGAFGNMNGKELPLVWKHNHEDMEAVIGHCLLEDRPDGIYAYGLFNPDVEYGKMAKALVHHGDLRSLSIYANGLAQKRTSVGNEVSHGVLREVSLVQSGANEGAYIDTLELSHGEYDIDNNNFEGFIYPNEILDIEPEIEIEIKHEAKPDDEENVNPDETPKKEEKEVADEKTVAEVYDEMTDDQKAVVNFLIAEAKNLNDDEEDEEVKHNAFDGEYEMDNDALMHDAMEAIIKDGKSFGSLKDSFLAHADEYGITDIDWLFPDYKNITEKPGFLKRTPDEWVGKVTSGIHHTPFARIKMMFADLREDEARAKGYPKKAQLKKEEVFSLLKRTIDPTMIYKKQKLDRQDIIDITDFDVVSWIKGEMRMMLDEEISRAILFGDGRNAMDSDKIDESKIIPIAKDAALYTIHYQVTPETGEEFSHAFIKAAVKSQDTYEGSGNLTMFVPRATVTDMLLFEDADGHRMYKTMAELTLALNVNSIVQVPAAIVPDGIYAVIVDLKDYTIGADKGGAISMFDDFDIDYNQEKYLIETRCSGALTKPFSAIVLEETSSTTGD